MTRIGIVALSVWLCFSAITAAAPSKKISPKEFETRYRNAYELEKGRMYAGAKNEYANIAASLVKTYKKMPNKSQFSAYLPIAIGAVFRLGITTGRDNYTNMYQLINQLDAFKSTNKLIDEVLKITMHLRKEKLASRSQLSTLYFIRAFNRIGWSAKLMFGIPWKNYVVFPPADIISMMSLAISDLTQSLELEGLSYETLVKSDIDSDTSLAAIQVRLLRTLSTNDNDNVSYKTQKLITLEYGPDKLARIGAKRYYNHVVKPLRYYTSGTVKETIAQSHQYLAIDEILSPQNRPMFSVMETMVQFMGLR